MNVFPIIKRTEAFTYYIHQNIGARKIPLAYVIWPDEVVQSIGEIQSVIPNLEKHGLVEDKLIARVSFAHPLY